MKPGTVKPGTAKPGTESAAIDLDERGRILLRIAWETVAQTARRPITVDPESRRHPFLQSRGAVFVSLHRRLSNGRALRGCLGTLEPFRPLLADLRANARAVVHRDPRFPPVAANELDQLELEVTELGPLRPIAPASRDELLSLLRPGVDGLVLHRGAHRATFLPQVWEDGRTTPEEFFSALLVKARLAADHWSPDLELFTYETRAWSSDWPGRR